MCLFFMGVVALSAHKEDRFLLPMFPVYILWICFGLEFIDKNIEKLRLAEKVEDFYSYYLVRSGQKNRLF